MLPLTCFVTIDASHLHIGDQFPGTANPHVTGGQAA